MRGLAAAPEPAIPDLEATVGQILDHRLRRDSRRPIAVALSGGGDSLALTLAATGWARAAGRPLLVLTVDHQLRAESAAWTSACAAAAERLGASFQALSWTGEKPAAGLPAAARAARHRLLADAARRAGARVILMGHTADDVLEARRMRQAGSSTPDPREWAPSPAWPEGRGVFLLRPLLGLSRAGLREWLETRGERWIDDPANEDLRFARARARRSDSEPSPAEEPALAADVARVCEASLAGGLTIARATLRGAEPEAARRFLAAACLCAAGTDRPPAGERVRRLAGRLMAQGELVATLAGARITADAASVRFQREAGEAARGGLKPLRVAPSEVAVWDGRFEVSADRALEVRALAGLARRLPRDQQAALRRLPADARAALPVVIDADGAIASPLLADVPGVRVEALAHARLLAACGAVEREPA